jgi:hypothetical protein
MLKNFLELAAAWNAQRGQHTDRVAAMQASG